MKFFLNIKSNRLTLRSGQCSFMLLAWLLIYLFSPVPLYAQGIEPGVSQGQESPNKSGLTLQAAISEALENNSRLGFMKARQDSMAAIPSQMGTLPDPVLSYGQMNVPLDTRDMTQEGMTQVKIGLSQKIPFPGKLGLKEESAEFEAKSSASDTQEFTYNLEYRVTTAWWDLFYLDRAIEVIKVNQDLLRQFVEIAKTKYKVGRGLQQDSLLAQVELSKLFDKEITLNRMRDHQRAKLNSLLNREPTKEIFLARNIDPTLPELLEAQQLLQMAKDNRPLLQSRKDKIQAAQSRLELSEMGYYPDFNVGVEYGQREGYNSDGSERANLGSFKISMSVPLYGGWKQSERIKQRSFELTMRQKDFENEEIQVASMLSSTLSDYKNSISQTQLFESGIIPQAKQTVSSMMAGYRVNKVDFLNLVRMQITLFNYETQYWRMLSRSKQAFSKLEAIIGTKAIVKITNQPEMKKETHE